MIDAKISPDEEKELEDLQDQMLPTVAVSLLFRSPMQLNFLKNLTKASQAYRAVDMTPFDYPSAPHVRRHGPMGYATCLSHFLPRGV